MSTTENPASIPVIDKLKESSGPTLEVPRLNYMAYLAGMTPDQTPMYQYLGDTGFGESKHDNGMMLSEIGNLEEQRALSQSWGEKFGYGVTKLIGKTTTATLGGTVGAVAGLFNAVKGGHDGKYEITDLADGDFQNGLDKIDEWMDG